MGITFDQGPEQSVIALTGECDGDTGPALTAALTKALAGAPEIVVVDVAGLRFADSTLLHALLEAWRTQNDRQRRLVVRGPLSVGVRRLLTETGTLGLLMDPPGQGCEDQGCTE
ncbi:STAS domain-containing protein [Streptomyces sp. NPDC016845]|uniref:STAS domain-containing protein n=1 Tax=Streptomyces sp. NPDC016845 TaxID=3364972 RepID=UPI003792EFEC